MTLGEKLFSGIGFAGYHTATSESMSYLWQVGIYAGILYKLNDRNLLGFYLHNPVSAGRNPSYGPIFPSVISMGYAHEIYSNTVWISEITGYSGGRIRLKTGIEIWLPPGISVHSTYSTSPHTFSTGFSWGFNNINIRAKIAWLSSPGLTPGIKLSYRF